MAKREIMVLDASALFNFAFLSNWTSMLSSSDEYFKTRGTDVVEYILPRNILSEVRNLTSEGKRFSNLSQIEQDRLEKIIDRCQVVDEPTEISQITLDAKLRSERLKHISNPDKKLSSQDLSLLEVLKNYLVETADDESTDVNFFTADKTLYDSARNLYSSSCDFSNLVCFSPYDKDIFNFSMENISTCYILNDVKSDLEILDDMYGVDLFYINAELRGKSYFAFSATKTPYTKDKNIKHKDSRVVSLPLRNMSHDYQSNNSNSLSISKKFNSSMLRTGAFFMLYGNDFKFVRFRDETWSSLKVAQHMKKISNLPPHLAEKEFDKVQNSFDRGHRRVAFNISGDDLAQVAERSFVDRLYRYRGFRSF